MSAAEGNTPWQESGKAMRASAPRFCDEVLDDAMATILSRKTPTERLEIAFGLWRFARQVVEETLRRDHPEWDDVTLRRHVAQRMSHGAV